MEGITEQRLVEAEYGMKEMFKRADKNKDGKVSIEECKQILGKIFGDLPKKTIDLMANYADLNGDGYVCYGEFTDIMKQKIKRENYMKEFEMLDKNGDGKICREEIKSVISKIEKVQKSDAEVDKIIKDVDEGGKGYLEYKEFLKLFMKH